MPGENHDFRQSVDSLTDSFHMSRALGSSNIEKVLAENRTATSEVKGERSDHCATEAPISTMAVHIHLFEQVHICITVLWINWLFGITNIY